MLRHAGVAGCTDDFRNEVGLCEFPRQRVFSASGTDYEDLHCFVRDLPQRYAIRGRHHSHSIVPGGLLVTSRTTRLISGTSLTMRLDIRAIVS